MFHVNNCAVVPLSVEQERKRAENERNREERKRGEPETKRLEAQRQQEENASAQEQAQIVEQRASARWRLYELEEVEGARGGLRVLIYKRLRDETDVEDECRIWFENTKNAVTPGEKWIFSAGAMQTYDVLVDGQLLVTIGRHHVGDICDRFRVRRIEEIDGDELATREHFMTYGKRPASR